MKKAAFIWLLFAVPFAAWAQETPSVPPAPPPVAEAVPAAPTAPEAATAPVEQKVASVSKESLFFSPNQMISIMRANQGFIAPQEAYEEGNQGDKPIDPGPRVISVTGIIYHSAKDWTIWLNGERVTPKNIPDRVMGLTVKSDRVHIRWMDIGNQRIVNITLRTNQRYLLDSDTIEAGS